MRTPGASSGRPQPPSVEDATPGRGATLRRVRRLARPVHGTTCVGCPSPGPVAVPDCAPALPVARGRVRPTPCPDRLASCFAAGEYDGLLRAMILAHKERAAYSLARPLGRCCAAAARPSTRSRRRCSCPCPHAPLWCARAGTTRCSGSPGLQPGACAAKDGRRGARRPAATRGRRGPVRVGRGPAGGQPRGLDACPARGARGTRAGRCPVSVLVCDDVLTTGATAREAQRSLEEAGSGCVLWSPWPPHAGACRGR